MAEKKIVGVRYSEEVNADLFIDTATNQLTKAVNNVNGQTIPSGGGGDFSTAEVTIVGQPHERFPIILTEGGQIPFSNIWVSEPEAGGTIIVPLYKNHLCIDTINAPASISGNATYSSEYEWIDITGDCTLTFSE